MAQGIGRHSVLALGVAVSEIQLPNSNPCLVTKLVDQEAAVDGCWPADLLNGF